MLHPALARALATAHIEDLHRAAARRHTVRLARRVEHEPHGAVTPIAMLRSASTRLRGRRAPQADGMPPTEIPQAALRPCQPVVDVSLGPRARIDRASSNERCRSSAFPEDVRSSMTSSRSEPLAPVYRGPKRRDQRSAAKDAVERRSQKPWLHRH